MRMSPSIPSGISPIVRIAPIAVIPGAIVPVPVIGPINA
jgi:hypothetical protein